MSPLQRNYSKQNGNETQSEEDAKWDSNAAFKFITYKQTHNGCLEAEIYRRLEIASTRVNILSPDRRYYRAENVISVEQRIS